MGADYLAHGGRPSSPAPRADAKPIERETIRAITAAVDIPVVAIGGISEANLPQLGGLGLAGAAVASALFARPRTCARPRRGCCRCAGAL